MCDLSLSFSARKKNVNIKNALIEKDMVHHLSFGGRGWRGGSIMASVSYVYLCVGGGELNGEHGQVSLIIIIKPTILINCICIN